jgi:hypothetical protein
MTSSLVDSPWNTGQPTPHSAALQHAQQAARCLTSLPQSRHCIGASAVTRLVRVLELHRSPRGGQPFELKGPEAGPPERIAGTRFRSSATNNSLSAGETMIEPIRPKSIFNRSSDSAGLDSGLRVGVIARISLNGTCQANGPHRTRSSEGSIRYSVARRSHSGKPALSRSTGESASARRGDSAAATITTAINDANAERSMAAASHPSTFERKRDAVHTVAA